jgi:hypothetical protein
MTAMLLVSGCGGSQGQITGVGAVPQAAVRNAHILKSATSGDLVYVSGGCGGICVLTYPQGQLIDSIHTTGITEGACSDSSGNVFVTNSTQVLEYQHGGTSPIATLALPGNDAFGCSVDPTTNNLAVVFRSNPGPDIAIFANESGSPITYHSKIDSFYCGYDNAGNLFVSGPVNGRPGLSELASGQSTFAVLSISGTLDGYGQVQWDGAHMTYESIVRKHPSISQLSISGSVATVIGTTELTGKVKYVTQSWIYNDQVIVPFSTRKVRVNKVGFWPYPSGGPPAKTIKFAGGKGWNMQGVTVSIGSK